VFPTHSIFTADIHVLAHTHQVPTHSTFTADIHVLAHTHQVNLDYLTKHLIVGEQTGLESRPNDIPSHPHKAYKDKGYLYVCVCKL